MKPAFDRAGAPRVPELKAADWRTDLGSLIDRLTLPATRRAIARLVDRWPPLRLLAWPGLLVASLPYIALRGIADDTGLPRQRLALEFDRALGLGATPSERLQAWLFSGELSRFDWFWLVIHASWFLLPAAITGYVVLFRWPLFRSLATVRLATLYVALIGFLLLPTEPPWIATDAVRLLDLKAGGVVAIDTNPLAAFPSLHIALPAAIALWARAVGMRWWALLYAVHTVLTVFDVIYLGEHFVADVLLGLGVAVLVVRWAQPRPEAAPVTADPAVPEATRRSLAAS